MATPYKDGSTYTAARRCLSPVERLGAARVKRESARREVVTFWLMGEPNCKNRTIPGSALRKSAPITSETLAAGDKDEFAENSHQYFHSSCNSRRDVLKWPCDAIE